LFRYLIEKTVLLIDLILKNIFNKIGFSQIIHDILEGNQYFKKRINNKNLKFFCPSRRSLMKVIEYERYEPETTAWISQFKKIKKQKIFWDIGAQIGLHSIFAATKFKNIKVISFEPSTSNLRILSRNISINSLSNKINIISLPISEKLKISYFKETKFVEAQAESTFGEDYNYKGEQLKDRDIKNKYKLLGLNLDFLIEKKILDVPNFIKMDVDGIEPLILKGALKLMKNKKLKEILIETNPDFKKNYKFIKNFLISNKFKKISSKKGNLLKNKKYKRKKNEILNEIYIRK